ncbi:hypothetical protein VTL71DRAFT_5357 [Oculimacula yallundae]|uniref:Uncharacterized protein n=1 Tax=Oculimacula yallundae TaxID=86028 RepID=A0ABR4C1H2_9HELO
MKSSASTLTTFLLTISAQTAFSALTTLPPTFTPPLDSSLLTTPSYAKFSDPLISTLLFTTSDVTKRQTEPDPDRKITLQDGLVFVLQCVNAGFREPCVVFGSEPGKCVSYFDFQPANSTKISDTYNDAVSSISTNTGGKCQFYKFLGCNNKGDDRGLTVDYNYDLSVPKAGDHRVIEYENKITSWRC